MESLPLKITDVSLKLSEEGSPEHTLATGIVEYNYGIKVRVRVMKSQNGPFAKLPNFRVGAGDTAKFFDYVFFGGAAAKALRDNLNAKVIASYDHKVAEFAEEAEAVEATATVSDDTPFEK
ncbi:MAG: hypothetical protein KAR39_10855 [Thermoplasmata archaeon]|nr:hypothetical protein [Thermoplasmata archaeon]